MIPGKRSVTLEQYLKEYDAEPPKPTTVVKPINRINSTNLTNLPNPPDQYLPCPSQTSCNTSDTQSQVSEYTASSLYSKPSNQTSSVPSRPIFKVKKTTPDYGKINKYKITINSLKNQLKTSRDINELTICASKILELEQQIVIERSAGYKKLEKERRNIESKLDALRRSIKIAETELRLVDQTIDYKINGYKQTLQNRIGDLHEEYLAAAKNLNPD